MSEMIERVARAICQVNHMDPDSKSHFYGNASLWEDYAKDARAAIKALREPTEAMVRAAQSSDPTVPIGGLLLMSTGRSWSMSLSSNENRDGQKMVPALSHL